MKKKSFLLSAVVLFCFCTPAIAQNGFYTINYVTDHLVFVDTLGTQTDIGYTGRDINSKKIGLAFHNNGTLYLSFADTLYLVNRYSGLITPLFQIYNTTTNTGISGSSSIAFDNTGQLYLFEELSGFAQGSLYTVNLINGAATKVSNNTSGNASILAISFMNSSLFGASELDDKLLKINTSTGIVSTLYQNLLGMNFTSGITNVNNELWGIDIINETTSNTTRFCKIDTLTGLSVLKFSKPAIYSGLAYGPAPLCYQYITVTDTLLINMGITGFNPISYENTIKIYPNPTNDHITIDNGNYTSLNGYQIQISNTLGQQVFQSAINQQSFYVDITSWGGSGVYYVNIINSNGVTIDTRKIVLQ